MFDDIIKLQKKYDISDMYGKIAGMPDDLELGIEIGRDAEIYDLKSKAFDSIVLAGMGGSAIAGDIARNYLSDKIKVPFAVQRNYQLPAFVNKNSLVICSSYSGNTEETLSSLGTLLSRNAKVIPFTKRASLFKVAAGSLSCIA